MRWIHSEGNEESSRSKFNQRNNDDGLKENEGEKEELVEDSVSSSDDSELEEYDKYDKKLKEKKLS